MGAIVSILLIPTGAILVGYGFGEFVMPLFTDDIHEQNSRGILSGYVAFVFLSALASRLRTGKSPMTESWELPTEFDFRAPLRRGFLLVQLGLLLARTISSDTFTTSPIQPKPAL